MSLFSPHRVLAETDDGGIWRGLTGRVGGLSQSMKLDAAGADADVLVALPLHRTFDVLGALQVIRDSYCVDSKFREYMQRSLIQYVPCMCKCLDLHIWPSRRLEGDRRRWAADERQAEGDVVQKDTATPAHARVTSDTVLWCQQRTVGRRRTCKARHV